MPNRVINPNEVEGKFEAHSEHLDDSEPTEIKDIVIKYAKKILSEYNT